MSVALLRSAVLVVALCAGVSPVIAGVPGIIHFQGILEDDLGDPLDGSNSVTFRIYDVQSGGTAL